MNAILCLLTLLGLIVGSFLNVVIYRLPKGESVISPGSHCPHCGQRLKAWELVPLVSYLLQGGRCRNCRARISLRYPAVEFLTALLFGLIAHAGLFSGLNPARLLLNLVFVAGLITLAFIDLETYRLPDVLTIPLWGLGILGGFLIPGSPTGWESVLSSLGVTCFLLIIALVYPRGMGLGDVKLAAALGAFLGFPGIFLGIFSGSLLGTVAGTFQLLTGKKRHNQVIPFGPYLALGAIFTLVWGPRLFAWWFR